jgi:hypothetical protein
MRVAVLCVMTLLAASAPARGQEKKLLDARELDRQLFDVLKEIHNRGADMFNDGDVVGCFRLFQGCLQTARAVLAHRPAEQKFIDESLAAAEKELTFSRRAYVLHESIDKLRTRLRGAAPPPPPAAKGGDLELLPVPPREVAEPKVEKKEPPKKPVPPKDGVIGRVVWQGQPLAGVEVTFVTRGGPPYHVAEGASDAEGGYVLTGVRPGRYTVLLTIPRGKKQVLPERYATATTSPFIVDVKGGGDALDFVLQ